MSAHIHIDHEQIADFCLRYGIRRLSLFGSVLREDFGPASDVDMLVEFKPETRMGYFEIGQMVDELEHILGRPVDLRTPSGISRYFREQVLDRAEPIYVAA
jgi:uncharacterized protein